MDNTFSTNSGISAKIILDSIAPNGQRLITLQTRAPKFLDAEFEKHRVLSSNSSSDRAIPIETMLKKEFFIPRDVRLNERGMQGSVQMDTYEKVEFQADLTNLHREISTTLLKWKKVHKQHLNRYLLGYSFQDKIATGTEWTNFFDLRLNDEADPAFHELAKVMRQAIDGSTPKLIQGGEYHLPYIREEEYGEWDIMDLIKFSVARCARVSYYNHDKSAPNPKNDLNLFDMLFEQKHMSPFEHQAKPYTPTIGTDYWPDGVTHRDRHGNHWSGNFRNWIQYRHLL